MNAYGLKKVFTFHGRVNGAKAFTDTSTSYGIHQVFTMLDHENSKADSSHAKTPPSMGGAKGRVKGLFSEKVKFYHMNGTMSSGVRNGIMKEFKEAEIGIMSNARCLVEGVDVPAVDTSLPS